MPSKLRLLIIEDDPTSAKLMQITLTRLGYEVAGVAVNGTEAIEMTRRTLPDLLLADINLPGQIDGIQTIELINKEYDIPVIYVTANTEDQTIQQAIKTNPIGYLAKPFNREHLKTMVEMGIHKHNLEQEVRQQRELLRVTFENIGDGVFLVNSTGDILFRNRASVFLLNANEASLNSENVVSIFPGLFSNEAPDGVSLFTPFARINSGESVDYVFSNQSGASLILEIQIISVPAKASSSATFVITFRDVTARRNEAVRLVKLNEELEQRVETRTKELRQKNHELEHEVRVRLEAQRELQEALEKEKVLSQFQASIVTTVSHEFRTPLTTIQSSAQLIERSLQKEFKPEVVLKHTGQIMRSAASLENLISDVLLVEKMSASKQEVKAAAIHPESFFQNLVDEFTIGSGRNHNLIYQHNVFPNLIHCDERLLVFIISNLLSNAFKYSDKGSTVMLVIHISQQAVKIIVKDDGIGISEENQKLLFNTFYRDPSVVNIEGTGVGLTIVKESVDLLGGGIEVQSKKGHGTTFTVAIPLGTEQ